MRFNIIFSLLATCACLVVTPSFAMEELNDTRSLKLHKHSLDIESLKYLISTHRLNGTDWTQDENDFHPLSHEEFINLQKDGTITKEQAEELINYAYDALNPILFQKSEQVIDSLSYSLNFLWIHNKKQILQETDHLMGGNEELLKVKILNPIVDWHSKQPQANIIFWYDDEMISCHDSVINNTKRLLSEKGVNLDRLKFKSIRTIDIVNQNSRFFMEDIPVYCRVDFSKVLTAQSIMTNSPDVKYVINIDCDIVAVAREQLFDQPTLYALNELGYVFGSNVGSEEENSFIMLSKDRAYELHNEKMITRVLQMLKQKVEEGEMNIDQEIYYLYKNFKVAMRNKYKSENNGKSWVTFGKPMIFPPTQYGGQNCGHNAQQIDRLKKALQKI